MARPSPGDLPNPGIKLNSVMSHALQADSLPLSHQGSKNTQRNGTKRKVLMTWIDNGVGSNLEPDILRSEVMGLRKHYDEQG